MKRTRNQTKNQTKSQLKSSQNQLKFNQSKCKSKANEDLQRSIRKLNSKVHHF